MSTSGADNFRVPRRGRYPRASAASAEVASATGPRSAPHRGYREERLGPLVDPRNPGGRGGGGRRGGEGGGGTRPPPFALAGKRPAPARSTAPPSWDLGRGRVERPAEAPKTAGPGSRGPRPTAGGVRLGERDNEGRRTRDRRPGGPARAHASPRVPALLADPQGLRPQGPARTSPVPTPETGKLGKTSATKSRLATLTPPPRAPREHAHGPGTPSPADARGRRPVTSPDRDLAKHVAHHRRAQRPGPRWVPRPAPRRAARGRSATPERDAEKSGSVARHRRADAGPAPRARNGLPPVPPRTASPCGGHGPGSLGHGRRSLPQKPAPPISGARAKRRRPGTTGTFPPVRPPARDASPRTADRSLPLSRGRRSSGETRRYKNGRQVAADNGRERQRDGSGSRAGEGAPPPAGTRNLVPAHLGSHV